MELRPTHPPIEVLRGNAARRLASRSSHTVIHGRGVAAAPEDEPAVT